MKAVSKCSFSNNNFNWKKTHKLSYYTVGTTDRITLDLTISYYNRGMITLTKIAFPLNNTAPHMMGLAEIVLKANYYQTDNIIYDHIKRCPLYYKCQFFLYL